MDIQLLFFGQNPGWIEVDESFHGTKIEEAVRGTQSGVLVELP